MAAEGAGAVKAESMDVRRLAFDGHIAALAGPAYRHALWLLRDPAAAEEAVQEAFTRAWQAQNTPLDQASFQPWIHRIVGNVCRSQLRRERVRQRLMLWARTPDDPLAEFERRNGDPDLISAIQRLKPRERTAVYLYYYEDRPASEVAGALGTSEANARVMLHRALKRLRGFLDSASQISEEAS